MSVLKLLLLSAVLLLLLCFSIPFGLALYQEHRSYEVAQEFCGPIRPSDSLVALVQRASAQGIGHTELNANGINSFWSRHDSMAGTAMCQITAAKGMVVSKVVTFLPD
jgi:hypothetical protein